MATTQAAPPLSKPGPQQIMSLASITGKGSGLPNRYILHAVEGFGKTSWGAQTPNPIFIQSRGETGLETLINANQLPETPHFPECTTWTALLDAVETLRREVHSYKTVVLDTINGAERLCHEHVCQRDFNSDWGEHGFASYGKGAEVSMADWRNLLNKLSDLQAEKRMTVVMLCHTKIKNFKNPTGVDYDRYQPDMNDKTWSVVHRWADCVLFGNFDTSIKDSKGKDAVDISKKGKAFGGKQRMLYAVRDAAYDAKNRLGLDEEISLGTSPSEGWSNFCEALKKGKGASTNG